MIIFLNHRDRLFCDVFETPNNNKDYFTIFTIIGPTISRSDASFKSIFSISSDSESSEKVLDDGGGEVRVGEEGGVSPSQVSAVLLALSHTFAMDFEHSSPGSNRVNQLCDPHANLHCQPFVITVPCKTATLKI